MQMLTSAQNPRIKRVVKLRQRRQRERERAFLVEGYRELTRAVEGEFPLDELYVCPEFYLGVNEPDLVERIAAAGAECFEVPRVVFEKIAYRDRPEGLLAVAPMADWTLDRIDTTAAPLLIVATSIEKPGNLGTILRCADAAGADGVIVCDRVTDIFNPNVVRASIGNIFTVPIAEVSTEELLPWLRKHNVRSVATSPDASNRYYDADLTGAVALVLGSEQYGLDEHWLASADEAVQIPMAGRADSLNVAMATAVVLFEAARQRA